MTFRVYIAAPMSRAYDAQLASRNLHAAGMDSHAQWIALAILNGTDAPSPEEAARAIEMNDADIQSADALLALSFATLGGEMFAELRYALTLGTPVVWVRGRQILSAYRSGVVLVDSVEEGIVELKRIRERGGE